MKAAQLTAYGGPEVISINEVPAPPLTPGSVRIEVYASSLNPFDTTVRRGLARQMKELDLPVTLGGDVAGVVKETGAEVKDIKPGDKVYGQANVFGGGSGAYAEEAVTSAGQIAIAPANTDFNEAAALPLVGVSALQALIDGLSIRPQQKLFINGGAGGIGSIAIQIAKYLGAYVATTARGDNIEYVRSLGADEVIDYTKQNFAEQLQGYDAVFDTVGGEDFARSLAILKRGGKAVSMIASVDDAVASELGVTASTQGTTVTTARLNRLRELVETGVVSPQIAATYPLDQVQQAFTARESGSVRGKVVLSIRDNA